MKTLGESAGLNKRTGLRMIQVRALGNQRRPTIAMGGFEVWSETPVTFVKHSVLSLFLVSTALFVSGCIVAPLKKQDITPSRSHVLHRHSQIVTVNPSIWQPSEVQTTILQNAIIDGINQSGLFGQATNGGRADFQLDVSLVSILWPTRGFNMSSRAEVIWKLTRVQDGKSVFQDTIFSEYNENMFKTFLGAARSYSVMRGAIRKNVQEGIDRLGKIDL